MDIHNVKPLRVFHDPLCDGHGKKKSFEPLRFRWQLKNIVEEPTFHVVPTLLEFLRMVQHNSCGARFSLSWHANRNQYPQLSPSRNQTSLNQIVVLQGRLIGNLVFVCPRQQAFQTSREDRPRLMP